LPIAYVLITATRNVSLTDLLDASVEDRVRSGDDIEAGRSEVVTDLDAWFDDLEAEISAARSAAE